MNIQTNLMSDKQLVALEKKIIKLDAVINKYQGYASNTLQNYVNDLFMFKQIEIGYRASCGTTDITIKIYREWVKILKLLRKNGVNIIEEPIKHKNAYATNNGGFWNSIKYYLQEDVK